jgi:hypothetical protein
MKWLRTFVFSLVGAALIAFSTAEIYHHWKWGRFVGYGVHMDVVLGNSDIGADDMYYAVLWNWSFKPFEIDGCFEANDVVGQPDSVSYRWDVQKRDSLNQRWVSLRGANTWVQTPFDGSMGPKNCGAVRTQILPFHGRKIAWVYKDWVTTGEPVRMAIYTSASLPPQNQQILYTDMFVVKMPASKKP